MLGSPVRAWPRMSAGLPVATGRRHRTRRHRRPSRRSHHGQRAASRPGPSPGLRAALGAGLFWAWLAPRSIGRCVVPPEGRHVDLLRPAAPPKSWWPAARKGEQRAVPALKARQATASATTPYDHMALTSGRRLRQGQGHGRVRRRLRRQHEFTREQQDEFSLGIVVPASAPPRKDGIFRGKSPCDRRRRKLM